MTHATAPVRRSRGQVLVSGLGQTLVTVGLVLLLFCAYTLWFTGVRTAREQTGLGDQLTRTWSLPEPAAVEAPGEPAPARGAQARVRRPLPALGSALARISAPRLGRDWSWIVVEGVSPADLQRGPGHYPGTALPGEIGNTVISGHRTTYGAPFNDLLDLRDGDAVVLETRTAWVTYRVTGRTVVDPGAVQVTWPVPGDRRAEPTERLLTLTTCHPEFSARERLVVHGVQESELAKGPGVRPAALDERP